MRPKQKNLVSEVVILVRKIVWRITTDLAGFKPSDHGGKCSTFLCRHRAAPHSWVTPQKMRGGRRENFPATYKFKQNTPDFRLEVAGEHRKGNSEKISDASTACLSEGIWQMVSDFTSLLLFFSLLCQFQLKYQFVMTLIMSAVLHPNRLGTGRDRRFENVGG